MILLLVSFAAFAGDFGSGVGVATIVQQGVEWNMSPVVVNYAGNLNIIMIGIAGIVWMPLLNIWGRMPVLFWSAFLALFFTLGCTLAQSFPVYYGMRALQGFTQGTGQTIGLALIKDMFFFHEHARKIGIWYTLFIASPFFGPFFGNFMLYGLGEWRPVFWLIFAWAVFLLIMIVIFGDETYYKRSVPVEQQPPRDNRLSRVLGIWQIKYHSICFHGFWKSYGRLGEVFLKPVIPLMMLFYAMLFMWSIWYQCNVVYLTTDSD